MKIQLEHGFTLAHADAVDNATARAAASEINHVLSWLRPEQRRALAGLGFKVLSRLVDDRGCRIAGEYSRRGTVREVRLRADRVGSFGSLATAAHEVAHALLDGGSEISAWRLACEIMTGSGVAEQLCRQRLAEEEALGVRP